MNVPALVRPAARRPLALALLIALLVGAVLVLRSPSGVEASARFASAPGLYEGDDVRVLGVKVGEVLAVETDDDGVEVRFRLDEGQKVPADVHAAIVSPSLVSGRFVQLAPVWTEGPELEDGATIPEQRTAVPVSFDEVKQELIDLSTALGPTAEGRGALDQAITTLEANLSEGRSKELRASVAELRGAADALSSGRSDLFATVRNLNTFTRNLALHDAAVGGFATQLDGVATVLRDNRTQVTGAVRDLRTALHATADVLGGNRKALVRALEGTTELSGTIASRADELAGVLHVAPHSLMGLYNIVERQAITGRAVLANADSLASLACSAVLGAGGTAETCRTVLLPLVQLLGLDAAATAVPPPGTPAGLDPAPATDLVTQLLGPLTGGLR